MTVTPDGGTAGSQTWQQNTGPHTATFTVKNTGPCLDTYNFTYSTSGPITGVTLDKSSAQVSPGTSTPVTATYSVGAAGSAVLTLTASGNASDQGFFNITVTLPPYQVAVTPDGSTTPNRLTNTSYVDSFTVQNTGANADTFALTCVGLSNITCGLVSPAGPIPLGSNAQQNVTVNYTTGSPGTGQLTLRAASSHSSDSGSYTVPVILRAAAVRPELAERQQFTLTRLSHRFFVKNLQPQTVTYNLTAICSGTAGTCQVSPASLSLAFGESQVATVSDTAATAGVGTVMLRAVDSSQSSLRDSNSVALTAVAAPAPVVSLVSTNPGSAVERDLCLTIAAGQNAAFECGDLRVIHALPAIRTVNKARVPTLLYNSAFAQPNPVFTAQVTVNTVPDSVEAILKVGGVEMARARWAGSDWTAGSTRQIALSYAPPDTISTGIYDYTFDVATISLPSGYYLTSTAGKFILVNRAHSAFGAGWWLAGLERVFVLPDSNRLWVGGDGSARLYSSAGANLWVGSNLDRPDTLRRAGSRYSRRLPGGVTVGFNSAGLHDSTVNRLGHRTGFGYDTVSGVVRLRIITLPSQGGGQTDSLNYDGNNKLSTFKAPGSRTATIYVSAERVDSIKDADNRATTFSYNSSSSKQISSRTDRRGTLTNYGYDAAGKLDSVKVNLQPDSIRTGFTTREVLGLATATPKTATDTANVYTSFFGARNYATGSGYIAQQTKFWLDRYGAPRQIVNPLGHQTIVRREEGQWAALATEQQAPNGFVTRARYDGRGNIAASDAIQPFGSGGRAPSPDVITRFHWDQRWDFADSIITPTGVTTSLQYDTLNGNRLWQQVGTDSVRRVRFRYDNTCGLVRADSLPNTPVDSIQYDGMCNPSVVLTPKRFDTRYTHDPIGRDTMVQVLVDTTPTYQVTIMRYDLMDRDTAQIAAGPALNGAAAETIYVHKFYNDSSGVLDSLSRRGRPDSKNVGTITTRWKYDRAGRTIAEIAPEGSAYVDSSYYDAAGNDTLTVTRGHLRIHATYDALNRVSTRILPSIQYRDTASAISSQDTLLPTTFSGYLVPADTQTFTYDSIGNIRTANNADAKVTRSYYPIGLIQTDSLWIRTVQGTDFSQHKYGVSYGYDNDGRRRSVGVPSQLDPQSIAYQLFQYTIWGPLLSVFAGLDSAVFTYSSRGDIVSIAFPGQWTQGYSYDGDGRLLTDTLQQQGFGPSRAITYTYDARNKTLSGVDAVGYRDTLTTSYSGLGYLLHSLFTQHGTPPICQANWRYSVDETFAYDPLGNRGHWSRTEGTDVPNCIANGTPEGGGSAYTASTGRMWADTTNQMATLFAYDSTGAIKFSQKLGPPAAERASYYAADGKLRATDTRSAAQTHNPPWWNRAFDEYRYDALGRRVWMRSQKSCLNSGANGDQATECQTSILRRTVWDGDNVLAEIQMPGGAAASDTGYWEKDTNVVALPPDSFTTLGDPSRYFGRVIYAHATGIDHPIFITRYNYVRAVNDTGHQIWPAYVIASARFMPFWNALGDATLGAFTNGQQTYCPGSIGRCEGVFWPYTFSAWNREHGTGRNNWQGSLLESGQDKSGLQFRRNRYYDPINGRFTQEDPIGLAGGLNLYGFANGDPVNFSDPFGLTAPQDDRCAEIRDQVMENFEQGMDYIERYVSHWLQGDADTGHDIRIQQFRNTHNNLKNEYMHLGCDKKGDDEDDDFWNSGGGHAADVLLFVPLPSPQVKQSQGWRGHRIEMPRVTAPKPATVGTVVGVSALALIMRYVSTILAEFAM